MDFFRSKNLKYMDIALKVFSDFESFYTPDQKEQMKFVMLSKNGSEVFSNFPHINVGRKNSQEYIESLDLKNLPHQVTFLKSQKMTAFYYNDENHALDSFECLIYTKYIKHSKMLINKEYGTILRVHSLHDALSADCGVLDDSMNFFDEVNYFKQVQCEDKNGIVFLNYLVPDSDIFDLDLQDLYLPV